MSPRNQILVAMLSFLLLAATVQGYQIISFLNETPASTQKR